MSDVFGALDERTVDSDIASRMVRFQGRRGSAMVHVVNILQENGWTSEDIVAIASGPPGSGHYDVVFDDADKCKAFCTSSNGHIKYRDVSYDITLHGRQVVQVRVHWLPICTKKIVLEELFSNYGTVLTIENEMYELGGFKCQSGTRLVTMEVSDSQKASIPHLLKFQCGSKALVTMRGRPPLCLKCLELGHVRGMCPDRGYKDTNQSSGTYADRLKQKKTVEVSKDVSPSKSVEKPGSAADNVQEQTVVTQDENWQQAKRRPRKSQQPKEKVPQAAPTTVVDKDEEQPAEPSQMEVSMASSKRKVEDLDEFTPMPRNKVASGHVPPGDIGLDTSEMLTQDSILDGILDAQSPHTY